MHKIVIAAQTHFKPGVRRMLTAKLGDGYLEHWTELLIDEMPLTAKALGDVLLVGATEGQAVDHVPKLVQGSLIGLVD